ncbi:MAG: YihY/virulence factor BrkB family protein [Bacilli bacterium]|nr:YihY/virulence factor BrkB family protein [Bacilli bacterium]
MKVTEKQNNILDNGISRFKEFLSSVFVVLKRPELKVLPGQLAFFFVLSIVPTITLLGYFTSYLNISSDFVFNFISKALNSDIASLVCNTITNPDVGLRFYFSILIAYYFASNGAASMIVTSNAIYGIKDSSFLKRRLKAFVMTIFLIILFIFILVVPLFGERIIELIKYVNLNANITEIITAVFSFMKGPVSWIIIFIFIKLLFTLAPDRKLPSKNVNYGAIFTSVMWIIVTSIYSFYINHFAAYDVFYGSLANIVILMVWFYLLSYIFTIGIALNYREEVVQLEKTGQINLINQDIL